VQQTVIAHRSHRQKRHYESVTTDAQLDVWLKKINAAELVAVDTETTSLDPMKRSWLVFRCR
jgi:uncharacterized protein YecE (DUF72 family)